MRVAQEGFVDAKAIGAAVRQLSKAPNAWKERSTHVEVLQELKLLWHVLVRFGEPDSQRDAYSPYQ
jgi:hypothetical protein